MDLLTQRMFASHRATENNCLNWVIKQQDSTFHFKCSTDFPNTRVGGSGGKVFQYDLGTSTWSVTTSLNSSYTLYGISYDSVGNYAAATSAGLHAAGAIRVSGQFNASLFTGQSFVVVGNNGAIQNSTNSISWSTLHSGYSNHFYDVKWYGDPGAIVVGSAGRILRTANGTTWVVQNSGTSNNLRSVSRAVSGEPLIIVGDNGTILRGSNSTNSPNWTTVNSGTTENLKRVDWLFGEFVAVGDNSTMLRSVDGITWTKCSLGRSETLHAVLRVNSRNIVLGDNGLTAEFG